ncbi:MAG: site-specific recombinase [Acidimicrobiaceae bacterium]|nr:site-specific recombinase [Acidimicrobiaceae bacterium]
MEPPQNPGRFTRCWTRHRYGTAACNAEPIRADELEEAVLAALLDVYGKPHAVREAIAATAGDGEQAAERAEQEVAALDVELRRVEAAIERYMIAFENGRLTEEMFAGRIHELRRQAGSLRARRAEAADAVGRSALAAYVPSVEQLSALHAELRALIESAPDEVRKMVAQAFVHELVVGHRQRILSTFRALAGLPDPRNWAGADPGRGIGVLVQDERSGGGGNRTRVLRPLNGTSPSAAGGRVSGLASSPASVRGPSQLSFPRPAR